MSKKIIGVTVGTPISPSKIEQEIKPIKTVNGKLPDKNGNVEIETSNGINFTAGNALELTKDGTLNVLTATDAESDNTLPITSAAVAITVGNIEILLKTI